MKMVGRCVGPVFVDVLLKALGLAGRTVDIASFC